MLSYPQAVACMLQHVQPVPHEQVALTAAYGRWVATPLVAPHALPPFAQSMMDGYAIRSRDTQQATTVHPVRLSIQGTLTAGASTTASLRVSQAMRIMTGAPVPPGADTILRLEDSEVDASALVLRAPLTRGRWIQGRGAEIRQRTVVLRRGDRLTPQRIGVALSLGLSHVEVLRQPRVAFVAPGDELLPPGAPWQPGKKWCSNLYALAVRARELGCESINLGLVPDTLESLTVALQRGLAADLVVILGASGRGDHDFAAQALQALGAETLFRGVATSPGRSVTVARCQHTLLCGLPGSPWAAYIGFEAFVWPAIRALLGQRPALPPYHAATLATALQCRPGATVFVPARVEAGTAGWQAFPLDSLLTVAQADTSPLGLIVVPPHRRHLPAGARIRLQLLTS